MNPLCQKVIDQTEQSVPPKDKDAYQRIVVAGLTVMFNKKTHAMLAEGADQAPDLAAWAGKGIAGLLGLLTKQSRGTMPFHPMLKAGITLLMHGLDYMEQNRKIQVTAEVIADATKAYSMAILGAAGINEQKLATMGQKANEAAADPQIAAQMKQHFAGAAASGA